MPKKSINEQQKLEQTRITLDEVKRTLIADLKRLNEDDYERLDIEYGSISYIKNIIKIDVK